MRELLETLTAWQGDGIAVGRAVVVRTFGSAPRPEGAVLLAGPDGRIAGSVSGGCVEGAAYEEVERAQRDGVSRVIRYGISDEQAWDVGLACGGTIDVLVEPAIPAEIVLASEDIDHGRAIVTPLPADSPGPDFGPHEPGAGEPTAVPLDRHRRGCAAGLARRAGPRRRARPGRPRRSRQRNVADGRARWPVVVRRGVPGPPETRRRRGGPGRDPARRPRPRARLRDRGHRRPAGLRHARPVPVRRPAGRRLAGRGRRRDRPRAGRCRSPS